MSPTAHFRNLDNYKALHAAKAKEKGIHERFMAAKTITRARGIMFGFKSKRGKMDR